MDVEWDDERLALILHFGNPFNAQDSPDLASGDPAFSEDQGAFEPLESVAVHLDAIRHMTCPYLSAEALDNKNDG